MKRAAPWCALGVSLALVACGPGEVVVSAQLETQDPETGETVQRPIDGLMVQLVPFDRDFIFDSLARQAPRPEPEVPAEIRIRQDSMLAAQEQWRTAENQALAMRENLQRISSEMQQYSPAEARYRQLFAQFGDIESRLVQAERTRDQAFDRYDTLQRELLGDLDQIRVAQETWEDEAFARYPDVVAARLQETRREILVDTTDASGVARFRAAPGDWWAYGRQALATEELYWNIRVNLERGDPVEVRFNRETAESRQLFR